MDYKAHRTFASTAVMSALKGLQDKIRQLELERSNAEDNLRTLATETSRYQDILKQGSDDHFHTVPHTTVSENAQGKPPVTSQSVPNPQENPGYCPQFYIISMR